MDNRPGEECEPVIFSLLEFGSVCKRKNGCVLMV